MARVQAMQADEGVLSYGMSRVSGTLLLLAWAAVLIAATVARAATSYTDHWAQPLHWFETFYRVGSLIYGGGQVVLPMLLTETVQYDCFVDDHGKRVRPPRHPPPRTAARSGLWRACSTSPAAVLQDSTTVECAPRNHGSASAPPACVLRLTLDQVRP